MLAPILIFASLSVWGQEGHLSDSEARQLLQLLQSPTGQSVLAGTAKVGVLLEQVAHIGSTQLPVVKKLAQMKSMLGKDPVYRADASLDKIESRVMTNIIQAALDARLAAFAHMSSAERLRFLAFGDVGSWEKHCRQGTAKYSTEYGLHDFLSGGNPSF